MREILSTQLERKIAFIELMYHQGWLTIDDIKKVLTASESTLIKDIKEINDMVTPIKIETSTKEGIRLVIPSNYTIDYVYQQVIGNSIEFSIIENIFLYDYYSVRNLAEALYSSISQIRFKIKKLNEILSQYDFQIVSKPLRLVGDELKISLFLTRFFQEKYSGQPLPFDDSLQHKINDYLTALRESKEFKAMNSFEGLAIWLAIRSTRINDAHYLPDNVPKREIIPNVTNESFWKIFDKTNQRLIYEDVFYRSIKGTYFMEPTYFKKIAQTDPSIGERYDATMVMLKKVERKLKFELVDREWLHLNIFNSLSTLENEIVILHDNRDYVKKQLHFFFPFFNEMFQKDLKKMLLKPTDPLYEEKVNEIIYQLIIHNPELVSQAARLLSKLDLAILSSNLNTTLPSFIHKHFDFMFNVHHIKPYQANQLMENKAGYDILLTNISGLSIKNGETLSITDFTGLDDITMLMETYNRIAKNKLLKKYRE